MISEVKFFSKNLSAFSLLEILVALVIVGVVISFPNWQSLLGAVVKNDAYIQQEIELKVLTSIAEQAGLPDDSVLKLDLSRECGEGFIEIGAGGIVKETQFQCNEKGFRISKSGGLIEQE